MSTPHRNELTEPGVSDRPASPCYRVLIVDDSAFIRRIIDLIVSDLPQFEVAGWATDGLECLEQAQRLNPDLITLDINMPNLDGFETLERLRISNDVPVLVVSWLPVADTPVAERIMDMSNTWTITKDMRETPTGIAAFRSVMESKLAEIVAWLQSVGR